MIGGRSTRALAILHSLGRFVAKGFNVAVRRDHWMSGEGLLVAALSKRLVQSPDRQLAGVELNAPCNCRISAVDP
jgi:hypothetical protein